jgi:RNA 2',3'-cyclic 3'-phosphodiesterase
MLRAFVAAEIPEDLGRALGALQADLSQRGFRARWVEPRDIHLTLKFLGQIPAGHVEGLAAALQVAGGGLKGFALRAAGLGVFPDIRRPRIVWVGMAGATAELAALQQRVEDTLAAIAFPKEGRAFRGHLTIGRFPEKPAHRVPADVLKSYASAVFGDFQVRELVLFQSDLQPRGPVYKALARARLAGPL